MHSPPNGQDIASVSYLHAQASKYQRCGQARVLLANPEALAATHAGPAKLWAKEIPSGVYRRDVIVAVS